jgi:putative ABC transport system permease protein
MIHFGSLREGIILAVDQLRANKFRSTLTILGIVIGVAVVMGMSAAVGGIRSSVLSGIESAGPKNFIVARFNFNDIRLVGGGSGPPWGSNPRIDMREAEALGRLDKVHSAIVDIDLSATFTANGQTLENVNVSANSAGWEGFTQGRFVAGHNFLESDVRASRPVVVVSAPLAEALFGALDPIGRTVRMNGQPFTVVGVYEIAENIFANIIKHIGIIPYSAARKHLNVDEEFASVLVVTASHATQEEAMDQVTAALRTWRGLRPADENNFALIRQEEMLQTFNRITGVFFVVMIALSSVALLVGGVGVIAMMMIAVTERTREIGVRKALGATRTEILWQFLIEAVTMTIVGAAVGMAIGGALAFLVRALTPIPAVVPLNAIIAALVMAATAGVLFGLIPAWRASRMDPVVALRYE